MSKNFDDLFNEFFDQNNNFKENDSLGKFRDIKDKITDMVNQLKHFGENLNSDDDEISKELGKPDSVHYFSDEHLFFEKSVWKTPTGDIIRIIGSDKPFKNSDNKENTKNLEKQLEEAINNEEYELAAQLRDKIKENKKDLDN